MCTTSILEITSLAVTDKNAFARLGEQMRAHAYLTVDFGTRARAMTSRTRNARPLRRARARPCNLKIPSHYSAEPYGQLTMTRAGITFVLPSSSSFHVPVSSRLSHPLTHSVSLSHSFSLAPTLSLSPPFRHLSFRVIFTTASFSVALPRPGPASHRGRVSLPRRSRFINGTYSRRRHRSLLMTVA